MMIVFSIFAVVLVWFSFKSLLGGIRYLRFFEEKLAEPVPVWTPFVTVICPCRGIDQGMQANLASLLSEDFPSYEVIFVIDDRNDPARRVIDDLLANGSLGRLLVAEKASESAQK